MTPRRGLYFEHRRYLDPDYSGRPLRCKVTRVAQGVAYFRAHYGRHDDGSEWLGSPSYVPVERFDEVCAREVQP